jgi:hypothetical protein
MVSFRALESLFRIWFLEESIKPLLQLRLADVGVDVELF